MPELDFRRTPVTLVIAAIAVAIEIVSSLDPSRRDFFYMEMRLGLLSTVWSGALWQPFTTSLLHGSLIHAAFNVWWLLVFGQVLEPRLGPLRYLGLVVLLAYVTMLPQFVITNFDAPIDAQVGCVGLSGIVYGLFGMLWIGRRWHGEFHAVCDQQTVQLLFGWLVFCILLTHFGVLEVANIAHGAGLLFGVLYGLALFHPAPRRRWIVAASLASLVVLASLIACPGHAGYEHARQLQDARPLFRE